MDKYKLAEWLHDNYEELAKANDWQTQEITRVKFDDLPQANKNTMLALADRLHNTFLIIARQALVSGQLQLPSERFDAEDWLGEHKDIWNHPRVTDRNDKESYEVADLMAEFANWYYGNGNLR